MDSSVNQAITQLSKGEMLRIDNARGQSIAVVQGMVWITQEGDPRDIFLSDGESFVFDQPGTALVQAMNDTHLIAFVGGAAKLIENAAAQSSSSGAPFGGHRALAARAQLHRDLALRWSKSRRIGPHSSQPKKVS